MLDDRAGRVLDFLARSATIGGVVEANAILEREGVAVYDVACRHRSGTGEVEPWSGGHALVLVRRGCFVHRDELGAKVLDPNFAYFLRPGAEQRYDHPHDHGDDCTSIELDPRLLGGALDGLPAGALPVDAGLDLEHRLLLADARRGGDEHELLERALGLFAAAARVAPSPSALPRARRTLVDEAREALAERPDRSLTALAQLLCVSPFHLSRSFRAVAGTTLARHRRSLRARDAMERLAAGEQDLARLAADVGFSDQSYMCRVLRVETGETPARLREMLDATLA